MRKCICGKTITSRFPLCKECEQTYTNGKPPSEWDEWLKFLVNDLRTESRKDREFDKNEDCFSDVGLDQLV